MVSMKDIANRLQISRCTVSNILNERFENKSYRKETIELVRATAKEMGYVSNNVARSLKTGSTGTIAIVVPDIANYFYIKIIKEVEQLANDAGFSLIICMAEEKLEKENQALTMLQSRCVDGVLISPVSYHDSLQNNYPFKIVCFDRTVESHRFPDILIDNYEAGKTLALNMLKDNAKMPLFLAGSQEDITILERYRGFRDALKEYGLPLASERVLFGIFDEQIAYDTLCKKIKTGLSFDSVFLSTNFLIYGVVRALNETHHSVTSMGGFERFIGMDQFAKTMHIVDQHEKEIGNRAFKMLHGLLKGEEIQSETIKASLI